MDPSREWETPITIVDPIALWHSVLLAIGLAVALGLRPRRAALVAGGLHLLGWLLTIGVAAAQLSGRK